MKILYSIQATGNGHIARANELIPHFQKHGEVEVFLSGSNSALPSQIPVRYRSKGFSLFYGQSGALDYWKMARSLSPNRIYNEAKSLPVEKYDLVINDFESITSIACKMKRKPFIHFGHQASFASPNVPRPQSKDIAGEFLLKHYAGSKHRIGLHFKQYDSEIFTPVLKQGILNTEPVNHGHVTVYLCHYSDYVVCAELKKINDIHFHLFSKQAKAIRHDGNITIFPINEIDFNKSLSESFGIVTGAGFETPAEALYMQKKLMCLPIKGQYEQACNAAALEAFGVVVVKSIDETFPDKVRKWMNDPLPRKLIIETSTNEIVQKVIEKGLAIRKDGGAAFEDQFLQHDLALI